MWKKLLKIAKKSFKIKKVMWVEGVVKLVLRELSRGPKTLLARKLALQIEDVTFPSFRH